MLMPRTRKRLKLCAAISLIALAWLATSTHSYKECKAEHRNATEKAKAEHPREINDRTVFDDLMMFVQCEGKVIDANGALLAALATLAIAAYTIILADATRGLQRAARQQQRDTQRALAISAQAADASKLAAEATSASVKLAQEAAAKERSFIGGGGVWHIRGGEKEFQIHVTNHGPGPLTIDVVRWGFCEHGVWEDPPPYDNATTNHPVGPMTLDGRLVKVVPFQDTWKRGVIFVRLEYRDLYLGQEGSYGYAMEILKHTHLPIQITDVPEPYLRKTLGQGARGIGKNREGPEAET